MREEREIRTIDVGFTKISDDVIVPTWREQLGEGFSFRETKFIWWILGAIWLFFVYLMPSHLRFEGMIITLPIFGVFGLSFYLIMRLPEKWIEFNRKDGYVYLWTSRKKRKLIGKWHIDKVAIKMNRRWISSGPKGQTSEYRYLIELFDNDPEMKSTPFWKFDNYPQKKGEPFFVLFELFNDPHSNDEPEDRALAWAITHQVEKFIRNFMAGKPLPESSTSTYIFSIPE